MTLRDFILPSPLRSVAFGPWALACAAATLAWLAAPASGGPIKVFVMAGQSNMVGAGDAPIPAGHSPQNDVLFQYQLTTTTTTTSANWVPLQAFVAPGSSYGSELTFAKEMSRRLAEPVAIIKVAANGTGLALHWMPSIPGGLYSQMITKVNSSLAQLQTLGYQPEVAGFVWVQAENDAGTMANSLAYDENLATLAASLRSDFGAPAMPFLLNELHIEVGVFHEGDPAPNPTRPTENVAALRQSQRDAAAADPNMHIVNADDLTLKTVDYLHFTGTMQLELGRRFADLLVPSADFNYDGVVDAADLGVWRGAYGATRAGDANSDGTSDAADFLLWQRQVGNAPIASPAAQAIPEPTTAGLAALVSLMAAAFRRSIRTRRRAA